MRIVIDLQGAQSSSTRHRGIGRYSLGLAEAIIRNPGDHDVHLALNGSFPETVRSIRHHFADILPRDRIHVFDVLDPIPGEPNHPRRIASELCREAFLARLDPDVVHVSTLVEGMREDAVASIGRLGTQVPTSATFYDAIPLVYRSHYLADAGTAAWYNERIEQLRRADLLLAISQSSANEALEYLDVDASRIVNVGAAADPLFRPMLLNDEAKLRLLSRFGIRRPFVMYTGGIDFRKNLEGLIESYAALPPAVRAKHQLLIVCECARKENERLLDLARRVGLHGDAVVTTGAVENSELACLYSLAKVFVFPSLHEGFGLPVLEAMQCGAPVLGSNLSSIPEVIGLDEAVFDPHDPDAIRDKLLKALTEDAWLDRLKQHSTRQAEEFSWTKVAANAISAFEQLHRRRHSMFEASIHAQPKRRLAYVSPLPPDRSGIANYSRELLPHLGQYYEIDVVVDRDRLAATADLPGVSRIIDAEGFQERADRYERVLYHIGNSEFHDYMLPLCETVPGVVVLHDFYLGGLIRHRAVREGGETQWLTALYQNHGAAAVFNCLHAAAPQDAAFTLPCCISLVSRSLGLIMHSDYARSLAKEWLTEERARRIVQIPLPCPSPAETDRTKARQRLGIDPNERVICSFGLMGPTKCNLEVVHAWIESAAFQDPNCTLVFVGARSGDYGNAVDQEISRRDLGERVKITGWIDDRTYHDYLAACDLAVQLRTETRGETSLALLDCLSHGVATIANANGSNAELPESVLCLLPDRFDGAQLRDAIDRLYADNETTAAIGQAARQYVQNAHAPAEVAQRYHEEIELLHSKSADFVGALASCSTALSVEDLGRLAKVASDATHLPASRTIHLDVSELADRGTAGKQRRLLRNAVRRIAEACPRHLRLELIRYDGELSIYVSANRYFADLASLSRPLLPDEPADFSSGDILLCLDGRQEAVTLRAQLLEQLYSLGVQCFFLVDDLRDPSLEQLPPKQIMQAFAGWLATVARSSGAVCSSESLADEFRACLEAANAQQAGFRVFYAKGWLGGLPGRAEHTEVMRAIIDEVTANSRGSGNRTHERRSNDFVSSEAELL